MIMEVTLARGLTCLFFFLLFLGEFCRAHQHEGVEVTKCIEGPYHKDSPSPEGPDYVDCLPWKESTCCTANFTAELKRNKVEVLYNFSWNVCGNLSQECEKYIKYEECFYQCEPNLIKWHQGEGAVRRVPVCASYCDKWFEACKNDKTCVTSWFDFNTTTNINTCPIGHPCRNFSEVYKNGKGLCDTMWGSSFKYEENTDNCMVMWFKGTNPNGGVARNASSRDPSSASSKVTPTQNPSGGVTRDPSSASSKLILSPLIVATLMSMVNMLVAAAC